MESDTVFACISAWHKNLPYNWMVQLFIIALVFSSAFSYAPKKNNRFLLIKILHKVQYNKDNDYSENTDMKKQEDNYANERMFGNDEWPDMESGNKKLAENRTTKLLQKEQKSSQNGYRPYVNFTQGTKSKRLINLELRAYYFNNFHL